MDGAASAIAIVSLAIQLVDTVQEISKFLKNVHGAPKEVLDLVETLDQLQGTLDNVRLLIETQLLVLRLPGSPVFITKAVENCEKQIKALEAFARTARKSFEHQHRLRKTWASMKIVAKKQDVEDIQRRLRDAKLDLQFAISSNSWQLQMYHIQNMVPIVHQTQQAQSVSTLDSALDQSEDEESPGYEVSSSWFTKCITYASPCTEQEHVTWYRGMFGTMTLEKKSKYPKSSASAERKKPLVSEMAWTFRPSFISYAIQLRYARSFGYVSPSLNVYPVLDRSDPVFDMCEDGDLSGLQAALSRNSVSPFVTDPDGRTLLHCAAFYQQFELSNWLLQVGLDAEVTDHKGLKALHYSGFVGRENLVLDDLHAKERSINTTRVLAQHHDDVSELDLTLSLLLYDGPPDGVDLLLSYSSSYLERFDITDGSDCLPPLALILICYSRYFLWENSSFWQIPRTALLKERKSWEPLVRRFIHKGADLHVGVPYYYAYHPSNYSPFHANKYATLLDVLFQFSGTPDEARTLGDEWLGLLASEGHDVIAYLKEEMLLHASQHQMTYPILTSSEEAPTLRELQFTLDDARPSVWWEWWMDPSSDIDLLDREFKDTIKIQCPWLWNEDLRLLSPWPFHYPIWHHVYEERVQSWPEAYIDDDEVTRRAHLATQRANRRLQKRHAKSTHSKALRYPQMPGAWQA